MIKKLFFLFLILVSESSLCQSDFFDEIEDEANVESETYDNNVVFSGQLDYRLHYAFRDQKKDVGFRRQENEVVSSRIDSLFQADIKFDKNISVRGSFYAEYDDKNEDGRRIEMDETYIDWTPYANWRIKSGRQIAVYGESNFFQVIDFANGFDERVMGLAELDETRMPVASNKVSFFQGRFGLDLLTIHEFRGNRTDEGQGDFDPYIIWGGKDNIHFHSPADSLSEKPNWGMRALLTNNWGDIQLLVAEYNLHEAVVDRWEDEQYIAEYPKVNLYGAALNYVWGSWLLKTEYGYSVGRKINYLPDFIQPVNSNEFLLTKKKNAHELVLGGRFSGINNLSVDIELYGKYLENHQENLSAYKDELRSVINFEYEMWNDNLVLGFMWGHWQENSSDILRARVDYIWRDEYNFYFGLVEYNARKPDALMSMYESNDRVYMGISYSF